MKEKSKKRKKEKNQSMALEIWTRVGNIYVRNLMHFLGLGWTLNYGIKCLQIWMFKWLLGCTFSLLLDWSEVRYLRWIINFRTLTIIIIIIIFIPISISYTHPSSHSSIRTYNFLHTCYISIKKNYCLNNIPCFFF